MDGMQQQQKKTGQLCQWFSFAVAVVASTAPQFAYFATQPSIHEWIALRKLQPYEMDCLWILTIDWNTSIRSSIKPFRLPETANDYSRINVGVYFVILRISIP